MILDPPSGFTTWATMRPAVLRYAVECPNFRIDEALRNACDEFFRKSRVWRTDLLTLLTTVAGTSVYTYVAPTNAEVCQVLVAWDGSSEIDVALPGEEDDTSPVDAGDDFMIGVRPINKLYLTQPAGSSGTVIKGRLALKPSSDALGIPTEAWTQWKRGIAAGAARLLVTERNKPWSAPDSYGGLSSWFDEDIGRAASTAGRTHRRPIRVTPA